MSQHLKDLVGKRISIIGNDGRNYVGMLKGLDQKTNLVLEDCTERVFAEDAGCRVVPIGVFLVRGDNVAIVGEVDAEKDEQLDLAAVRAAPMKPIVH
mmetsp:Transcript_20103/g.50930  ORF Transcript_20103/g.50930 Transcript_20103/m.50930 type:complete len:97 (-) Transcript_20103:130-420(-)